MVDKFHPLTSILAGPGDDVLVSINDGPPVLLKNVAAGGNHWLGVRLIGKRSNPDAIGARITWQAGDLRRSQQKVGGGSYLSSHAFCSDWGAQADRQVRDSLAPAQPTSRHSQRCARRSLSHDC